MAPCMAGGRKGCVVVVHARDSLEKTRVLLSLSGMARDLMEGVANMGLVWQTLLGLTCLSRICFSSVY